MGLRHCRTWADLEAQGWGPNTGTHGPELLGIGVQGARRKDWEVLSSGDNMVRAIIKEGMIW